MSNYKLEVENTEKLKNDINSAFTEINTELEKDDDLIASNLFDVDKKISELKKSRKKWAEGNVPVSVVENGGYGYGIINPIVSFKIDEIFITIRFKRGSNGSVFYFIVLPYKENRMYFSSIYLGNRFFINNTTFETYGEKIFMHYMNDLDVDHSEKVALFQKSLDTNKFIAIAGVYSYIKKEVDSGGVEVSYIAFE